MSTDEPVTPQSKTSLLADLETRQDELLRLLAELEARTEQALAALGVKVGGEQPAPASTPVAVGSDAVESKRATAGENVKPRRAAA
jgi:hypothetical protein